MENQGFHPNLDAEYQISSGPSQFPALPPVPLPMPSAASSSDDRPASLLVDKASCCATAWSFQKKIRALSRRLHLKDTALHHKDELLRKRELELIEKEAAIKELKQNLQ